MSIYIFILLYLILVISIVKNKRVQRISILFLIFFLAIIVGIRDGIGTDFETYTYVYKRNLDILSINSFFTDISYEPFYSYIENFTKIIGQREPTLFFLIISLITSLTFYKAMRNFRFSLIAQGWFIYFCFLFFSFQFNVIRHGVMASFVWLAFSYIPKNNIKKYVIFIIVGMMFHLSAIIFLPFYWLLKVELKRKHLFLLYLIGFISITFPFLINFINFIVLFLPNGTMLTKLIYYTNDYYGDDPSYGITLGIIIYTFITLLVFPLNKKLEAEIYGYRIYYNSLVYAVFISLSLNSLGVFVERTVSVMYLSLVFLLPSVIYSSYLKKLKILLIPLFILYGVLIFSKNITSIEKTGEYQFIPYITIFK